MAGGGSVRHTTIILDKTGSLAATKRYDYLPFGEELYVGMGGRTTALCYTGSTIRQRFTSKERDSETGLDYFVARYYTSTQGRFTSADSWAGSRFDPQSLNLYTYVRNNPLALVDPTGHMAWTPRGPLPGGGYLFQAGQPPPATKSGDLYPCVAEGSPNASEFGKIAEVTIGEPGPISTRDMAPVPSIIRRPTEPVLPSSAWDYVPVVGPARQFLFDYTTHNFEHALISFEMLAVDLSPLTALRRTEAVVSLGVKYGPDAALTGTALARQLGATGETAVRAVYDIGEKTSIRVFGRLRRPDGLTNTLLSEVKNVNHLSYTRQLRDYAAFAQQTGRRFDLYVRSTTQLSGPLSDAVRSGIINLLTIP